MSRFSWLPLALTLAACTEPPCDDCESEETDTVDTDTVDTPDDTDVVDTDTVDTDITDTDVVDTDITDTDTDLAEADSDTADSDANGAGNSDTGTDTGNGTIDTDVDPDTDVDIDTDVDTDTDLCASLLGWSPGNGAGGVALDASVSATFDFADPTASLTVLDGGAAIAGTQSWSGSTLMFTPGADLLPATTYEARVTWSCGFGTIDFTTFSGGSGVGYASLVDRTWEIDPFSGVWVQPGAIATLLQGAITGSLLLGVTGGTATTLDLRLAGGDAATSTQLLDFETVDLTGVDFSNDPVFSFQVPATAVSIGGVSVAVYDAQVSGEFAAGGASITNLDVQGRVDTAALSPLIAPGAGAGAACLLSAAIGTPCVTCPNGTPYCLPVDIQGMSAPEIPITLVSVATTQPGATCSNVPGQAGLLALGVGLLALRRRRD